MTPPDGGDDEARQVRSPEELVAHLGPVEDLLVVLDFDGTLAPLVEHPDDSALAPGARDAIEAVLARTTVVVLTGRPVDDVLPRLEGLPVAVVGGHGTQAITVEGERTSLLDVDALRETLDALEPRLRDIVDEDRGWYVEPKPTSIGVHHRRVADDEVEPTLGAVRDAMDEHLGEGPGWIRTEGKAITELRPDGVDKGTALQWLLDRHEGTPLVLGDDVTDEDAFAVAREVGGHAVLVAEEPRETNATLRIDGPDEVVDLLRRLAVA